MSVEERAYWNKDVARMLDIGESTVRKWCLFIEKHGYVFIRGNKDSRAFLQHDINALTYLKELTKTGSYTLDQAAKLVVEKYGEREGENGITAPVTPDNEINLKNIEEMMKELVRISTEQLENSKAFNEELLKRLEEKDKIIIEQQKKLEIAYEVNEERAIEERSSIHEYQEEYPKEDEIEPKKKGLTERIKNLFKK